MTEIVEGVKAVETIVEASASLFDHRRQIAAYLKRLRYRLNKGHLHIHVFGAGGTGKSTLGRIIHGRKTIPEYVTSTGIESYGLGGDVSATVKVAPGQERHVPLDWPVLYQQLNRAKSAGVINVVSWGYHAIGLRSYRDTKYFAEGMEEAAFFEQYAEDRRKVEIDFMRELVPRLKDAPGKLWMVTVVTKQDLWWPNRTEVLPFYENGEYNEFIEEIRRNRGESSFPHFYVPASLLIGNFRTEAGELLAPNSSGYDQQLQMASVQKLMNKLDGLSGGKLHHGREE
ncbi:MAG: hypothetical protein M3Y56_04650 [Armatimonadota bacterium]|nr:hypothetical protein [Armatimonadota bacterium]